MEAKGASPASARGVDLEAIQKLVAQLEADLARVREGSADVQRLRDEVDMLKALLASPTAPQQHTVRDALHGVRSTLDREWDTAKSEAFTASRYVAEIGRILGM